LALAALVLACSRRQVAVPALNDAESPSRIPDGRGDSNRRDAGSPTCVVDVYVDATADRGTVRTQLGRAGVERITSLSHGRISLGRRGSDNALFFGRESDGPIEWVAWIVPHDCGSEVDLVPVDGEHLCFCDGRQTQGRACASEADERDGNRERTIRTRSDLWIELLPAAIPVSRTDKRTVETVVRIWSASNYTSPPVDTKRRLRYAGGQRIDDATTRILVRHARGGQADEFTVTSLSNLFATLERNALLSREGGDDASWLGAWKGMAITRRLGSDAGSRVGR
jgi:hypothetical protein